MQWVDLPDCPRWALADLERLYFAWVPRLCASHVLPRWSEEGTLRIAIEPFGWPPAIRMERAQVEEETWVRPIVGGWLAAPGGSLEFELRAHAQGRRLIVAVRDLSPRLPKPLYFRLQATMHERSTYAFLREMKRRCVGPTKRRGRT